jgi:hypothetical protein
MSKQSVLVTPTKNRGVRPYASGALRTLVHYEQTACARAPYNYRKQGGVGTKVQANGWRCTMCKQPVPVPPTRNKGVRPYASGALTASSYQGRYISSSMQSWGLVSKHFKV